MFCATTPSFAMDSPNTPPPRRIFRPLRSAGDLISLRYQPPIWVPVFSALREKKLYFSNTASSSLRPLPCSFQVRFWLAARPNGTAQLNAKDGSLPV